MKIIYMLDTMAIWGGVERITAQKINSLAESGYEVTLLTTGQGNHPFPYAVDGRVARVDLGINSHRAYHYRGLRRLLRRVADGWRLRRRLRAFLDAVRPAVVVCNTGFGTGALPVRRHGYSLVVEVHTIYARLFGCKGSAADMLRQLRLKRQLRKADVIVTLTEADAREWRKEFRNVECIPNCIGIHPSPSQREGLVDGKGDISPLSSSPVALNRRAIFVGRLEEQKGVGDVIDIWRIVNGRHPDWDLHIYGEGSLRQAVEKQIEVSGARVYMHEPTADLAACYDASDLLVLTSEYEPFGLVIAEAMSHGLPVVAYDCPYGPSAILGDCGCGVLVNPGDRQAFADAVCAIIDDNDRRLAMGKAAVAAAARYSPGVIMPMWHSLFERITSNSFLK